VTLLRAQGLAIGRGGRLLLHELDLSLAPGEALQATGPNGVGKSSLLRCLAGLLSPASGRVEASGGTALADERLPLDPELSLERALSFWTRLSPTVRDLPPALAALGLEPLADVPVRMLSSGQRKRAALTMVAMSAAPVWLLDEPLNGLDTASIKRVAALIDGHRSGGGAVIAATHQPMEGAGWRTLALAA
jgi:heme exporter protein A